MELLKFTNMAPDFCPSSRRINRIYPGTEIARRAVGEGVIAADDNLLFPKFYVDQQVRETLKSTTDKWLEKHPEWF